MGTTYSVKIDKSLAISKENLKNQIEKELSRINLIFSTYNKKSEISKLNNRASIDWINISFDLHYVLLAAKKVHLKSNGLYDVTVEPLVNLWGFGSSGDLVKLPHKKSITATLKKVGFEKLLIDKNKLRLKKLHPALQIDLSSIAKGYGVDKLAELLRQNKADNFMIEIGGEVRTYSSRNKIWHIGLENPDENGRSLFKVIKLKTGAMATSGNYRNYYMLEGKKISHIINPLSGYPEKNDLLSVSVFADDCMQADAYATAFMMLGKKRALRLANLENLATIFIVGDGENNRKVFFSSSYKDD